MAFYRRLAMRTHERNISLQTVLLLVASSNGEIGTSLRVCRYLTTRSNENRGIVGNVRLSCSTSSSALVETVKPQSLILLFIFREHCSAYLHQCRLAIGADN